MNNQNEEVYGEDKYGEDRAIKSNVLLGIIGSILGALIGSVVWVVIYQLGYVAAIAGLAISWCSYQGYALFSKGRDMKAVVISTFIAVVVLILAHLFCWGLDIYSLLNTTLLDAFLMAPMLVFDPAIIAEDPSIIGSFFLDLAIGLIFIFVGIAPQFRRAVHERRMRNRAFSEMN